MINQTPWIERTFSFDFPVGLFPCILERVRGTPARLEEMIGSFPLPYTAPESTDAARRFIENLRSIPGLPQKSLYVILRPAFQGCPPALIDQYWRAGRIQKQAMDSSPKGSYGHFASPPAIITH